MREIKVIIENGLASTPDSSEEYYKAVNMFFTEEDRERLISGFSIPITEENVIIHRYADTYSHKFMVYSEISEEKACDLQLKAGYHPHGYGFYAFRVEHGISSWLCHYSCD